MQKQQHIAKKQYEKMKEIGYHKENDNSPATEILQSDKEFKIAVKKKLNKLQENRKTIPLNQE